jgi:hypothetical protein
MLMLAILVIASLVNSFYVPLAGRRVRLEHLAGPAVFLAFAVSQLVRRKTIVRLDAFSALAAAWVVTNGISSWLYAPNPSESFVHVIRLGVLAATFLTVANLPPLDADAWRTRIRIWLALGMVQVAYGLLIWILARFWGIWWPGASLEVLLVGISIQGTQFERNLFGILAATLLAVTAYMLIAQRQRGQRVLASTRFLVVACALSSGAVVLALTRSAWLAVVVASPMAYLLFDRRPLAQADRPLLHAGVALPVLLGALIGILQILPAAEKFTGAPAPAAAGAVAGRLSTFAHLDSDFTVNTRVQDARWAVNDWLASPLLGRGTGSFAQIHGTRVGTEAWISNLVLHTMVDTGLVGLFLQISLFGLVAWRTWQAASTTREPRLAIGLKAMTLGFLVIAVAYQFTEGTWLAVFWIHLGLMVNGIYCARAEANATD